MTFCTYITIYSGNLLPPFYIGYSSVERLGKGYHGTVSSALYKSVWKSELRLHPELFITKIIKIFNTRQEACLHETLIQSHLQVHVNPLYINMRISGGKFYNVGGYKWTESSKQKAREAYNTPSGIIRKRAMSINKSISNKQMWQNPSVRKSIIAKISNSNKGRLSTTKGIPRSEIVKHKISIKLTGLKQSEETRSKKSIAKLGIPRCTYLLQNSFGDSLIVDNLALFCIKNTLDRATLYRTVVGNKLFQKHHKGFKLIKIIKNG